VNAPYGLPATRLHTGCVCLFRHAGLDNSGGWPRVCLESERARALTPTPVRLGFTEPVQSAPAAMAAASSSRSSFLLPGESEETGDRSVAPLRSPLD
jgi:hypothetical protein